MEFIHPFNVPENSIFDTHAHYDSDAFDETREDLLFSLSKNGVYRAVNCACDTMSIKTTIGLSEKYPFIYSALGYHPEDIDKGVDFEYLKAVLQHKKVVAVGEIGLDYHYRDDNKDMQKKVFAKQIEIAMDVGLPVIVHDRDAHGDTLEILKYYKPKAVLHCYSGSAETAEELIKMGMYIGIGGAVTFKNAKDLKETAKIIPIDRMLLETDAPYLAPVPFRGKLNSPEYLKYIAQEIATLRNIDIEEVKKQTTLNAKRLFNF